MQKVSREEYDQFIGNLFNASNKTELRKVSWFINNVRVSIREFGGECFILKNYRELNK